MKLTLNIYGVIIEIIGNQYFLNYFEREYSYFKTRNIIQKPTISVYINQTNLKTLNHPDLCLSASYKSIKYSFCICDLLDSPKIFFNTSFFGYPLLELILQTQLLHPLLSLELLKRNMVLIRASGVTLNSINYLFIGPSHAGKTTNILKYISKASYLGNDYVILSQKGGTLPFPSPIHLTFLNIRFLQKRLPFSVFTNLDIKSKKIIYTLSNRRVLFSTSINPILLFQSISLPQESRTQVIFLSPINEFESPNSLILSLLETQFSLFFNTLKGNKKISFIFKKAFKSGVNRILKSFLSSPNVEIIQGYNHVTKTKVY